MFHGNVGMGVKGLLDPYLRNSIVGGKVYGYADSHLRGFCTPNCWDRTNEVGRTPMILWQKATKGSSMANLGGTLYEIDELRPY